MKEPKKKPKEYPDHSDLRVFGNTTIDVLANGHKETMDRRSALTHKMFESAMKGKVSMQRFLYKEFQKNTKQLAIARIRYDELIFEWILNNPDFGKLDYDIPLEVQLEIDSLKYLLNYYFPGQYPLRARSAREDSDNGDN